MVGAHKKRGADGASLHPATQAEQSPVCPPAQSGRIRQARRIFAVRRGLLNGFAGGDALTGLLSTAQSVMPRRCQPIGQDRKGLPARLTDSAPHPDRFVLIVVALAEPPSVADDRVACGRRDIAAAGGPAGSPRVDVVFRLWQCDKENHGWREGRR